MGLLEQRQPMSGGLEVFIKSSRIDFPMRMAPRPRLVIRLLGNTAEDHGKE